MIKSSSKRLWRSRLRMRKETETSLSPDEVREVCKGWETVHKFVEEHHPSEAVALRGTNLFNDNAVSYSREILKRRQKQVPLDSSLLKSHKKTKSQQTAVVPLVTSRPTQ
jgi:hypothetical protein